MTTSAQELTGSYVSDPVHSTFAFVVEHMKVAKFRASFDEATVRIVSDDAGIRCEGSVQVESVSITKPTEFRESVVYGEEFFNAKNYPTITFRCGDVVLHDDGTATASGELTIKDITKPFTATGTYQLPVEDPFGDVRAGVDLSAKVDRRDWNLNWQAPLPKGGDVLGYEVELSIQLDLIKEK